VQAVSCQDEEDDEIRNHHRQVEGVCVVYTGKRSIRDFVPVVTQRTVLDRQQKWSEVQQI
jgi:hypothetical protein